MSNIENYSSTYYYGALYQLYASSYRSYILLAEKLLEESNVVNEELTEEQKVEIAKALGIENMEASPKTKIILQSIFPVTAGCVNLDNTKIDTANKWVKAIAAENGCRYLDTQSILKDDKNCLKENYCNSSDGIHMGKEAYVAILEYIRTHAITD